MNGAPVRYWLIGKKQSKSEEHGMSGEFRRN
jgi:hypothetical protein